MVTAGRLAPQKDPTRFARIATKLRDHADFTWIGAGSEGHRVFAGTPVTSIPWATRERALTELASAAVYLSTSAWEGLPLALVEAQAMGIPAVCTDVPGNRDVIQHGTTGFLGANDEELVHACCTLIADPARMEVMSRAARLAAKTRFDVGSLGAEALAMYTEAIGP